MNLWRCYYHLVWATKLRVPVITPQFENIIYPHVRAKSREVRCEVFAVNGMPDHIHIAVSIPPSLSVGQWVKLIKGATSHEINTLFPKLTEKFRWQGGYSVHTFGAKHLEFVVRYIDRQKEHHSGDSIQPYLEETPND